MKRITVKAIALALGMCAAAGLSAGVQAGGTSYVANWIDTAFQNDILFGSSVNEKKEKKADQTLKVPSESSQEAREFTFNQPTTTDYFGVNPTTKTYKNNLFFTDTTQQITNTSQSGNDNNNINNNSFINSNKPKYGHITTPNFSFKQENNLDSEEPQFFTGIKKREIQDINDINNKLSGRINGLYDKVNAINNVLENGTLITNITNQIENFSKELKGLKATIDKLRDDLAKTNKNVAERFQPLEEKLKNINPAGIQNEDLEKLLEDKFAAKQGSINAGNAATIRNELVKVLNDSDWAKAIKNDISNLFDGLEKLTSRVNGLSEALSGNQQIQQQKEINKVPLFEENIKPKIQPIKSQNKDDLNYLAQVMTSGINQKKGK